VKFKDADLIGIPVRVTVGIKSVADGNVEIKLRRQEKSESVSVAEASQRVGELVRQLHAELKNKD